MLTAKTRSILIFKGMIFFEKAFKPSGKKGEKWAVIIGIGDYKDPDINDLSCTVSDAKAIYELLLDRGGFKADKVKLLLDKGTLQLKI